MVNRHTLVGLIPSSFSLWLTMGQIKDVQRRSNAVELAKKTAEEEGVVEDWEDPTDETAYTLHCQYKEYVFTLSIAIALTSSYHPVRKRQ